MDVFNLKSPAIYRVFFGAIQINELYFEWGGPYFFMGFGAIYLYYAGVACANKLKSNPIGVFKVAQAVLLSCPSGQEGIRQP